MSPQQVIENAQAEASRMTAPQRRALRILTERDRQDGMSPSDLGSHMRTDAGVTGLEHRMPQGSGRIGGTMAHRLMRRGLVIQVTHWPPAYRITTEGRLALRYADAKAEETS